MQSWTDKLNAPSVSSKKRLVKAIADMPAGALMYISTPMEIDQYIRKIPYGMAVSVKKMRDDLARKNEADCTCPMTTGIFLRIVAEASFERINLGDVSHITAFWRVIETESSLAQKLSFGAAFVGQKRREEKIKPLNAKP
jgi:hypothetical protein